MADALAFAGGEAFRAWLAEHGETSGGLWLLFGKKGGPQTLSAQAALEEALCFGWIDGQMQRIDETAYRKYFAPRRANSKWSEKNKALATQLEKQGRMTDRGRARIDEAKRSGQWDTPKAPQVTQAQVDALAAILKDYETAHANYLAMSPSVQRTYARAYHDAKTDAGRASRIAWMVDRLNRNLKPM